LKVRKYKVDKKILILDIIAIEKNYHFTRNNLKINMFNKNSDKKPFTQTWNKMNLSFIIKEGIVKI